jgi:hypothetical protein
MDRCLVRLLTILFVSVFFLVPGIPLGATTYDVPQTAGVKLAWDPNDPAPNGCRIYQRTEGQSYDYSRPSWTGSDTSGTTYNLDWDTTHYFVVRAYAGSLESGDSDQVSFVTPSPVTPPIQLPQLLSLMGPSHPAVLQRLPENLTKPTLS